MEKIWIISSIIAVVIFWIAHILNWIEKRVKADGFIHKVVNIIDKVLTVPAMIALLISTIGILFFLTNCAMSYCFIF